MEITDNIAKVFINEKDIVLPDDHMNEVMDELKNAILIYNSAVKEVATKLEILNDEFQSKRKRNPIEYTKSRVKSVVSAAEKLERKGYPISVKSMKQNLNDMAGIRVICSFVEDIYTIADMLIRQNDITLIQKKDYIKRPKVNGYRSLHIVIEIPVFFSDHIEPVKVEVQIRTIAMDFWASLEHKLHYKTKSGIATDEIVAELKDCADVIANTDLRMQNIHHIVERFEDDIDLVKIKG